jgi:2-oxoglutarate/2-oxoacid ferredoxin oxidoreductase subunit beta
MVESAKAIPSTWCPGCGDFGVLAAVKKAFAEMKVPAHETVLVGGIGCSGGIHNFLEINGLHALHGRLLAQAVGVKLANPKLMVVAAGGDGDGYAIGMGHFMHAFKKNASILYILMMNETYGLTKGQASPTAPLGYEGNIERPFDGILTALSQVQPNFVARTFSGDPRGMTKILTEALQFNRDGRGFAFVEDLSPCVTYNDTYKEWRQKVLDISTVAGYDPTNRKTTFQQYLDILEQGRIPIGVFHRPPSVSANPESLELKLMPDRVGPAAADIGLEGNLPSYRKLLEVVS